jgi:alkylation response protein AidB-like acyl-CoA dehydrogenase
MDFEPSDDQRAILEAVDQLLAQHAGAARAVELARKDEYDFALERALEEAGFAEVALGEETGALEAALVVEAVARAAGACAAGAQIVVAPLVSGRALPGPIAIADAAVPGPVRFAAQARSALVLDGDAARVVGLSPGAATSVRSSFGFPFGRFAAGALEGGDSLGAGSGERLRSWWRVALALEAAGAMGAALALTVDYAKKRRQFGRAIGSFQAVQHRLAECKVLVEGARWLALEAAWRGAPAEAAATALGYATTAAERVFADTHQLSGAMGYTRAHELHVFSMRLPALRLELGGAGAQRRAIARARWRDRPERLDGPA